MPAAKLDITIEQGATWELPMQLTTGNEPLNINNASGFCQIRQKATSPIFVAEPQVVFTDATAGYLNLVLSANDTESIPTHGKSYAYPSAYTWDFKLTLENGNTYRILEGTAFVVPAVTKP